jgi:hypothetical protein
MNEPCAAFHVYFVLIRGTRTSTVRGRRKAATSSTGMKT